VVSLSKQLVLKSHVRFWLETDASAEDIGERSALLSESVDNGGSRRSKWCLEHITQYTKYTVEAGVVLGRRFI
jgi:hypothetical protein